MTGTPKLEPISNLELLDTLRDIEAFFRKEYAYEVENMGAGGSQIAAGRWKRYYMALYNLAHDLPELIANQRTPSPSADAGDGEALKAGAAHLKAGARGLLYGDVSPFDRPERERRAELLRQHAARLESLASRLQVDARDAEHFPAESEPARCCFRLPNGNRCSAERETHSFCCAHAVAVRALASGAKP